jgi:hypothetical protein
MPALYYSFERQGVRFLVLDTPYVKLNGDYAGIVDKAQTDWFIDQLDYDGPMIVFHHVPFNLPTVEHRLLAVWNGTMGCIANDRNGRRILDAMKHCPNVLGTFTAHAHIRSEDPLGGPWQFMAPPASEGQWRYVKIASTTPSKSIRVAGEPAAGHRAK